jgi:hypothetical protein
MTPLNNKENTADEISSAFYSESIEAAVQKSNKETKNKTPSKRKPR